MAEEQKPIALPPAAQQLLLQLQTFQQQGQAIALQRESLSIQKLELEKALEELKKAKEGEDVFKAVGPMLIKSTKAAQLKELGEKQEAVELRLKSLEKQDERLRERVKEVQGKLTEMLKGSAAG